ncbi:MAG: RNA polymerase sigma factor [Sphingobacteriales bacterium]|nr:RNA polymerase sigma factor [Sphingobacteriales bacterium]
MTAVDFKTSVVNSCNKLRPFAISLTKNSEDAQDLLQETAYRALVNENLFKENTNLKAWLFTIMRNIFINNYRRKVKHNTIIDTSDNTFLLDSKADAPVLGNAAEVNFMMEDIHSSINLLSEEYRLPFMMHYEGFKYQEIADKLQVPLGTVKSRIFFARKELKERLKIYHKAV